MTVLMDFGAGLESDDGEFVVEDEASKGNSVNSCSNESESGARN